MNSRVGMGHDLVGLGDLLVLVNIDLGERYPAGVVLGQLVDDRAHHAAWSAPLGPAVHDQLGVVLGHRLEAILVHHENILRHVNRLELSTNDYKAVFPKYIERTL